MQLSQEPSPESNFEMMRAWIVALKKEIDTVLLPMVKSRSLIPKDTKRPQRVRIYQGRDRHAEAEEGRVTAHCDRSRDDPEHTRVGDAIASFIPTHPLLAAIAGFASHFAIDAIPHWDYPLQSIVVGKGADNRSLRLNRTALTDLAIIATDAGAGLALALWLFATPASAWVVGLGAVAAVLPDPLQFVHSLFPKEPLNMLQRFHGWIHSWSKLAWQLGVSSQVAFATAVSALASALH
jgi:hypothetical protein